MMESKAMLPKGKPRWLIGAFVLSFLTSLINPFGIRVHLYGVTGYALLGSAKWYSTLAGALDATNTSIFKTDLSSFYFVLFLAYFLILLIAFSFLTLRKHHAFLVNVYPLVPNLLFFWFGFFFIRFIPLATFMTAPIFVIVFSSLLKLYDTKRNPLQKVFPYLWLPPLLLLAFWMWLRPKEIQFVPPKEQCSIIREHRIPPNILLSTELAGYMYYCLFPQKQQLDARDDFFEANDTIGIYGKLTTITDDNIKNLIDDNEVNVVLVSKENDYVTTYFNKKLDWSLVYVDYNGMLFIRDSQVSPDFLTRKKLRYVDLTRNLGFDPKDIQKAITELEVFHNSYPKNILAIGQLASLYRFHNEADKAEQLLHSVPESQWGFTLNTEMGRIQAAKGSCELSEQYFLKALANRGEQNVSKTVFDMAILYAACFHDAVKAKHYFERYTSYPLPEIERERATALAKEFGISLDPNE
jgi:hypothetical protein